MSSQKTDEALPQNQIGENLAPFNPSMQPVVELGLSLLNMTQGDILYELGCGDGRFMIAAALATPGLKCIGVEYDSKFSDRAKASVLENELGDQVTVHHANVLDIDFSDATAVFVYLVPKGLNLIAERLQQVVGRGGRVVSYIFSVPGLTPTKTEIHKSTKIYLYETQ